MIIVMPNGRAQPDDRPGSNAMATAPAFAKFDQDLLRPVSDMERQPRPIWHRHAPKH